VRVDPDTSDLLSFTVDDSRFKVVAGDQQRALKLTDRVSIDFATDDTCITSTSRPRIPAGSHS